MTGAIALVRFEGAELDVHVRCESCWIVQPISRFLDDKNPELPEGVVDFCLFCETCSGEDAPGYRFGDELYSFRDTRGLHSECILCGVIFPISAFEQSYAVTPVEIEVTVVHNNACKNCYEAAGPA